MKLTDIQPMEKWVELEKKINQKFQIQSITLDKKAVRITDFVKWANRICPVIKFNKKGGPFICGVAQMNMMAQAQKTRKAVVEECDAGLLKIVVPIFVKDKFIGTAGGCGRLAVDGEVDTFLINKAIGIDEKEVEALSDDIRPMTMELAQECADFIEAEIKSIIDAFEAKQK